MMYQHGVSRRGCQATIPTAIGTSTAKARINSIILRSNRYIHPPSFFVTLNAGIVVPISPTETHGAHGGGMAALDCTALFSTCTPEGNRRAMARRNGLTFLIALIFSLPLAVAVRPTSQPSRVDDAFPLRKKSCKNTVQRTDEGTSATVLRDSNGMRPCTPGGEN